jgi:hypothetical protein
MARSEVLSPDASNVPYERESPDVPPALRKPTEPADLQLKETKQ